MIRFGNKFVGLFFFLMLVFPTVLQFERAILLCFLVMGSIFYLFFKPSQWLLAKSLWFILLFCIASALFSMLWGVINGAPGAISISTVFIFWPILYIFIIGISKEISTYIFLVKVLSVGTFTSAVSALLLLGSRFFPVLGLLDPYFEVIKGGVGIYDGYVELSLKNMPTVMYGLPFFLTILFFEKQLYILFTKRWVVFFEITTLVSIATMILSGRKAFIVIALISVPLALSCIAIAQDSFVSIKKSVRNIIVLGVFLCLILIVTISMLDLNLQSISSYVISGFDFNDQNNISANRRYEQFNGLMSEWYKSPWFGYGHGSYSKSVPGDTVLWAYELQYVALLFQLGIFGMLVYVFSVSWLFLYLLYFSKKQKTLSPVLVASLVALVCFMIANASNPYLGKFDYLWTLFFPIGLVNAIILNSRNSSTNKINTQTLKE